MCQILKQIFRTGIVTETATRSPTRRCASQSQQLQQEHPATSSASALAIRHVDAGSCNGCELEIHALNNPYYNIEGCGIKFVASPRHADMLLVTGPVSRHMERRSSAPTTPRRSPSWWSPSATAAATAASSARVTPVAAGSPT